jgi:hypothetical protein
MEPDDLLCSRNARPRKALAWADGTSQRASGWAGEEVARSGRSISPHPRRENEQAWQDQSLVAPAALLRCHFEHAGRSNLVVDDKKTFQCGTYLYGIFAAVLEA